MIKEFAGVAFIPVIVGIVEVLKKIGITEKLAPLISLILGVIFGILYASEGNYKQGVLLGIYFGLSASGLYSGVKELKE